MGSSFDGMWGLATAPGICFLGRRVMAQTDLISQHIGTHMGFLWCHLKVYLRAKQTATVSEGHKSVKLGQLLLGQNISH